MLKNKIFRLVNAVGVIVSILAYIQLPKKEVPIDNTENTILNEQPIIKKQKKLNSQQRRANNKTEIYKPEVTRSALDRSNFATPSDYASREDQALSPSPESYSFSTENYSLERQKIPSDRKVLNKDKDIVFAVTAKKNNKTKEITHEKEKVLPGGGSVESNSCSPNISGGSFNHPIGINLSCSNTSTIKYCLELDTGSGCCDPRTEGTTYSSQIVIGPKEGNYCLSFYGESDIAGNSSTYQQNYIINLTSPNFLVSHPQLYYQTTELAGKSIINSSDFGKTGFTIGQINLKTHDPGPAGLNYDCEQIITNYVSFPAPPNPLAILTALDVSLDNPAIQIEIPLRLDQLEYGDNYITSYITNANYDTPISSCSTSKVTLSDFDFFQDELTFGDTGNNSVREFTGGLSPYGFFEEETNVYRGPAGEGSLDNSGEKLEYGMFGIFY